MNWQEAIDKATVVVYNEEPVEASPAPRYTPFALLPPKPKTEETQVLDGEVENYDEDEADEWEDDLEQGYNLIKSAKLMFDYLCDYQQSRGLIGIRTRIEMKKLANDMGKWINGLDLPLTVDVPPDDPAYAQPEDKPAKDSMRCEKCGEKMIMDKEMWAIYCPKVNTEQWQGHTFNCIPEGSGGVEFEEGTPANIQILAAKVVESLGGA